MGLSSSVLKVKFGAISAGAGGLAAPARRRLTDRTAAEARIVFRDVFIIDSKAERIMDFVFVQRGHTRALK
jgi:hypothetical protein